MEKYILYKTTNTVNGKYYIGVHHVNGSSYLGSGLALGHAIKKYGRDSFIRITIEEFDNEQDAYDYEAHIVNEDFIKQDDNYNIAIGGGNPPTHVGEDHYLFGKKICKETRDKMRGKRPSVTGINNYNYKKIMSKEQRQKISNTKKINYIKRDHPNFGIKFSEERCKKMSKEQEKYIWCIKGCFFKTSKKAGTYFNVHRTTIKNWCKNINKPDCYRINKKINT